MNTPKFITNLKYRFLRKRTIPHIETIKPIVDELVDLSIKFHYDYDTIYAVYEEWNNDFKATESVLISAFYMNVNPLDITQESMRMFSKVLAKSMISMSDFTYNI